MDSESVDHKNFSGLVCMFKTGMYSQDIKK